LATTPLILILLGLILLSAFFAGSEIGMMSINRYKLKYLVKQNNKQAIRVHRMLARPDKLLSVVLIGNTLANIVASTIATLIGQYYYGELGVAVATVLLTSRSPTRQGFHPI
jgi:Mg2+/Co2+ transporter CorB